MKNPKQVNPVLSKGQDCIPIIKDTIHTYEKATV